MPKVILKFEAAVIKEFPLLASSITIGRKPDNDLVIDHPAVSGHHCRIMLQGDTYFVEDLNSTNGTLVNDKKIIKAGIHHNDVVAVAKHTIIFLDDRGGKPAAAQVETAVPKEAPPAPPPPQPAQIGSGAKAAPPGPGSPAGAGTAQPENAVPEDPAVKKKVFSRIGGLRVIEGAVDSQTDFVLNETSTYLGKSDRASIKIKAGMMAPDLGALVSRKPDGYVIVAIKEGYPKVNGMHVEKERRLNEGDVIEVGGTKMQFYLQAP